MRKRLLFLFFSFFVATVLFANPVEPEKALEVAKRFWSNKAENNGPVEFVRCSTDKMAKAGSRLKLQENNPQFYIFTPENSGGFVIVSGEDELPSIVGYSTQGADFSTEMPSALVEWLGEYSEYVDDVRAGVVEPSAVQAAAGAKIEPMLKTSWNQGAPYNNLCPTINGQLPPTGCTATAMAQIMKFHEWPKKPKCDITYLNNITGETEKLNISSHVYDWANMLDHYRNGYNQQQANAVAQLMVDVGKAINSNYALGGTGSNSANASNALVNVFDYTPQIVVVNRRETTEDAFVTLIRDNLEARQPLLFTGHSQNFGSGHAFVCDGIDENNLLHIDWGWDGSYNGYFSMTYMEPSGIGTGGGDGRYNVAQAIIANIRPREAGEPNRAGDPTLYYSAIYNPKSTVAVDEYVTSATSGEIDFRISISFLNWSHSSLTAQIALAFENENGEYDYEDIGLSFTLSTDKSIGYYIDFSRDISGLPKGNYNIKICYKGADGAYKEMPGDNNFQLVLSDTETKLCKLAPDLELAELNYAVTPMYVGDKISFTANFINRNTANSLVLIAPVLNTLQADGTYSQKILTAYSALIEAYDDREVYVEFHTSEKLSAAGTYYISFMFNTKNYYIDRNTDFNKANTIAVKGQSDVFTIKSADNAIPAVTELSVSDVAWGDKMLVNGTLQNIASVNESYSGTLGLFIKSVATDNEYLLGSFVVDGLEKGASKSFSFASTDFFPELGAGAYTLTVCEYDNGWNMIKHNVPVCRFNVTVPAKPVLYAVERMEINNGDVVVQGDAFDAKVKLSAINGDINGFVKVAITSGLTTYIKSDYIPISVKENETVEVVLPCTSSAKTPLARYSLSIVCYDSTKKKIGNVSNNSLAINDNGYFWIGDATAVDSVEETAVSVTAAPGAIMVNACVDAETTVCGVDGATVYKGCQTDIAVSPGLYIVTVNTADGDTLRFKVLVRK